MSTPTDSKCSRFSRTVWEEDSIFSTEMLSLEDAESIEQEYREEIASLRHQASMDTVRFTEMQEAGVKAEVRIIELEKELADSVAREADWKFISCAFHDHITNPYQDGVQKRAATALKMFDALLEGDDSAQPSAALAAVRETLSVLADCDGHFTWANHVLRKPVRASIAKLTAAFGIQPETGSAP